MESAGACVSRRSAAVLRGESDGRAARGRQADDQRLQRSRSVARMAADPGPARLGGAGVAGRLWRLRLDGRAALSVRMRVRAVWRAVPVADGTQDVRSGAHRIRHGRAEELLPPAHAERGALLVPGLLRAGFG